MNFGFGDNNNLGNHFCQFYNSQSDFYSEFDQDNFYRNDAYDYNLFFPKINESEFFNENLIYYRAPPTSDQSFNNKKEKKEKIFAIKKEIKKKSKKYKLKGRRTNKDKAKNGPKGNKEYHTKFKEDNMIQKIKILFIKNATIFLNKLYDN